MMIPFITSRILSGSAIWARISPLAEVLHLTSPNAIHQHHENPPYCVSNYGTSSEDNRNKWRALIESPQGNRLNPCNSKLHPAVLAGMPVPEGKELPVQDAYTPKSRCFGCGPAHENGLQLKSIRISNGLEANVQISSNYCAFPGIVNGGIISTLMDCHGNWTAAIALMDKSCLPMPPLTLTSSVFISYKDPTPPDTPLVVRSKVVSIKESSQHGMGKATVEVDVFIYEKQEGGPEKLLVQGTVMCKRLGALRAL